MERQAEVIEAPHRTDVDLAPLRRDWRDAAEFVHGSRLRMPPTKSALAGTARSALHQGTWSLTTRELQVVRYACRGESFKVIGYELGISVSTAATLLARAMARLGVKTRAGLIDAFGTSASETSPCGAERPPQGACCVVESEPCTSWNLTPSERMVAEAAASGRSNQEISCMRGTSLRTIANQLASIYRKLRINSRAELAARLAAATYREQQAEEW